MRGSDTAAKRKAKIEMILWKAPLIVALGAALAGPALAPLAVQAEDCQGNPGPAKLSIVVEGVPSNKGLMTASLYPGDKSQFLIKNGALKVWSVPAQAPTSRMCIWLPRGPGTYAVAVYHDANSNHRLDIGMFGPTEAYGFSNNPRIMFAKPSFDSVKFQARAGETTVHVRLNHP
ncbi:MAG: DUF2141 domain-containing protein [Caulobacteraceae bacterium]